VRDGRYYPYEFSHDQNAVQDMSSYHDSFVDFAAVLTKAGLSDLLGLSLIGDGDLDASPMVEMTQGRSNIAFVQPPSFVMDPEKYVTATWFMGPEGMRQGLKCIKTLLGHSRIACYHWSYRQCYGLCLVGKAAYFIRKWRKFYIASIKLIYGM
jgi:hypothetical protein